MPIRPLVAVLAILLSFAVPAPAQPGGEPKVQVSVKSSRPSAAPGDQVVIAVILDHAPGWHIHTNAPVIPKGLEDFQQAIPTEINIVSITGAAAGPIQWPKSHEVPVAGSNGKSVLYGVFDGHAVAYIPLVIDPAATGQVSLTIGVGYQACDHSVCLMQVFSDDPGSQFQVSIPIAASGSAAPPPDPDFAAFEPAVFATMLQGTIAPDTPSKATPPTAPSTTRDFGAFGLNLNIDTRGPLGLTLVLLVAILGGFVLNLTPCVLPVVPIKIMSLSHAAGNPARCFYLGLVMSAGVIAFWLAIGSAIAFISGFGAISSLFKTPWFSLGVGLFIAVMAVGMLGMFTVRLPQFVYMVSPTHESAKGSFVFGIMTAILSTPCTAPFMGSAAAWAATQNAAITLTTFAAIGLGMALPYLLLSANPKWISRVPRTGPGSELVKQVMGLFMVAVAVFFLGLGLVVLIPTPPAWLSDAKWWGPALFVSIGTVWMTVHTFQFTHAPGKRVFFAVGGLLLTAGSFGAAWQVTEGNRGIPWQPYTPELVAKSLADNKVVVMDFTAEWYLNCKAIESAVLYRAAVVPHLNDPRVVPIKVDLTARQAAGWKKLSELGEVGIPLLAIVAPGSSEPSLGNAYTPDMVLQAIAQAKSRLALAPAP